MTPAVVQVPAPPRGLEPPAAPPEPPAAPLPPAAPSPAAPPRGALVGWLVGALAVAAVVHLWAMVVELHRASVARRAADGVGFSLDEISTADDRVATAAGVQVFVLLVAAVLFIVWFYRLCCRIRDARPDAFRYGVGWAIGGWFTPIWSLFRPKQMVDDAWRAAEEARGLPRSVPGWVHLWWAAWLISNAAAWWFGRYGDDSLDAVVVADRISAFGDAVGIVAALLAIALVRGLSRRAAEVPAFVDVTTRTTAYRFNPPPGWPEPPPGWVPPPNWRPDPSWPPPPAGWQLWVPR
jgi:eukaryotic-like serine/threonine-protein kinase